MSIISRAGSGHGGGGGAVVSGPLNRHGSSGYFLVGQSGRDVEIMDDFHHASYSLTIDGEGTWGATIDSGGTITSAPAEGGHIVLTTDGTDDDDLQLHSHDEWFLFDATKDLKFEIRAKQSRTDSAVFYGLCEIPIVGGDANATILAESCCGFHMDEAASVEFGYCDDTTLTNVDTGVDVVADTFNTFTFTYNAQDKKWRAYVDGAYKSTQTATTNPGSEMGIVISMRNGSANSSLVTVDYVYCSAEM